MALKIANNAYGTISASITSAATQIVLGTGQGARFPAIASGDWGYATLSDSSNNLEIVKITARTGDTFTVERGQDGTTARAYAAGDRMDMRPVAACFESKLDTAVASSTYATQASVAGSLSAKLDSSVAGTTYAKLAGGNTLSGTQKFQATHWKVSSIGSVSGVITIDLAAASTYSLTITGNTTLSFLNYPTGGYDLTTYLKITNGGAFNVTFPTNTKTPGGLALGLTVSGKDLLAVWYDFEQGAYVVGLVFKDYK